MRSRRREPSRYNLWLIVAAWTFIFVINVPQLFLYRGDSLKGFGIIIIALWFIGYAAGELLCRAGKRTLAALIWVSAFFVLWPLGITLMVASFYAHGTVFTVAALLFWGLLPVWYGVILWRYLSTRDGGIQQG